MRIYSHLSGSLKNYRSVARNDKFSSRFSMFACFCGDHLNIEPSKLVLVLNVEKDDQHLG